MPSSKDPYRKQNETAHRKYIEIFKICNIRVSIFNFLFHISPITRDWGIYPATETVHSQHSILSFSIHRGIIPHTFIYANPKTQSEQKQP